MQSAAERIRPKAITALVDVLFALMPCADPVCVIAMFVSPI